MRSIIAPALIVLFNTLPLLGVLQGDWQVFELMFLYWLENIIIGVFSALLVILHPAKAPQNFIKHVFIALFFSLNYGAFCLIHGIFVFILFGSHADVFKDLSLLYHLSRELLLEDGLIWAAGSLFLLNVFYFLQTLWHYDYQHPTDAREPDEAFKRMAILHLTIIGAGFLIISWNEQVHALMLLIALKTGFDLYSHYKMPATKTVQTNPFYDT